MKDELKDHLENNYRQYMTPKVQASFRKIADALMSSEAIKAAQNCRHVNYQHVLSFQPRGSIRIIHTSSIDVFPDKEKNKPYLLRGIPALKESIKIPITNMGDIVYLKKGFYSSFCELDMTKSTGPLFYELKGLLEQLRINAPIFKEFRDSIDGVSSSTQLLRMYPGIEDLFKCKYKGKLKAADNKAAEYSNARKEKKLKHEKLREVRRTKQTSVKINNEHIKKDDEADLIAKSLLKVSLLT